MYGCKSYADWDTFLGAKEDRPIANNTRVRRLAGGVRRPFGDNGPAIAIRLHTTDVVTLRPDGTYELNSGGWRTPTTRDRINNYAPARTFQHRRQMMICAPGDWANAVPFWDGVRVNGDGQIVNMADAPDVAPAERLRKTIDRYARGFVAALASDDTADGPGGLEAPSAGDCWYCLMFERAGMGSNDHLLAHLGADGDAGGDSAFYFVPTLAVNALRETGRTDLGIGLVLGMGSQDGRMHATDDWEKQTVARAIRRYLTARLVDGKPANPTGRTSATVNVNDRAVELRQVGTS